MKGKNKTTTKWNGGRGELTDDQVQELRDLCLESERLGHVLLEIGERAGTRRKRDATHVLVARVRMRVTREKRETDAENSSEKRMVFISLGPQTPYTGFGNRKSFFCRTPSQEARTKSFENVRPLSQK